MTDAQFRHFVTESLDLLEEPVEAVDDLRRQEILAAALSYAYSNADDVNDAWRQGDDDGMLLIRGLIVPPFDEQEFKAVLVELDDFDGADGVRFRYGEAVKRK